MLTKDEALDLFAYGSWATGLMFEAAESLPADLLTATAASSFPSIAATLAHLVGAEWIWLHRWLGESRPMPAWVTQPDLPELKRQLASVEAERSAYLETLSQAEFSRPISYRNLAGKTYTNRLDDLIRHVVNHSTYHRGQLATQLRQLGRTPPGTDLIAYVRLVR